jgi:nitroreductase
MDVIEAIKDRRSTRAFSDRPVSKVLIERILGLAVNAPSSNNLQPWEITVVMGNEKERLSRTILKAYHEKQLSCGSGASKPLPPSIHERGIQTNDEMKVYTNKIGVPLEDFINQGSCKFYDAPVAMIICLDDCFSSRQLVDVGTFISYLMLVAHVSGLGTCPVGLITDYADEIKELLNIPDNKKVILGLALGYADTESPVNQFHSSRTGTSKLVRWI